MKIKLYEKTILTFDKWMKRYKTNLITPSLLHTALGYDPYNSLDATLLKRITRYPVEAIAPIYTKRGAIGEKAFTEHLNEKYPERKVQTSVKIPIEQSFIGGVIDIMLDDIVIEVKSVDAKPTKPKDYHVIQLAWYLMATDRVEGILTYLNIDLWNKIIIEGKTYPINLYSYKLSDGRVLCDVINHRVANELKQKMELWNSTEYIFNIDEKKEAQLIQHILSNELGYIC